jgi:hypothetical protein
MTNNTYSIWFKDTLNGWTKSAAMYSNRTDAVNQGAFVVREGLTYTGGAYRCIESFRVFPFSMDRADVMARIELLA